MCLQVAILLFEWMFISTHNETQDCWTKDDQPHAPCLFSKSPFILLPLIQLTIESKQRFIVQSPLLNDKEKAQHKDSSHSKIWIFRYILRRQKSCKGNCCRCQQILLPSQANLRKPSSVGGSGTELHSTELGQKISVV